MLKATKLPTSTHWSKPNNIAPMSARDVSLYVMEIPSTSIVPQPSTTRFLMATPMYWTRMVMSWISRSQCTKLVAIILINNQDLRI